MAKDVVSVLIVVCSRCGRFLLARADQKTKTCPYCGFKVDVQRAKKVASAKTAQEASAILRKLKSEAGQNRKHPRRL